MGQKVIVSELTKKKKKSGQGKELGDEKRNVNGDYPI
jgi:hypothetical protein